MLHFDAWGGSKGSFLDRIGVQTGPGEGFGHSCQEICPQVPKLGGKWRPNGAPWAHFGHWVGRLCATLSTHAALLGESRAELCRKARLCDFDAPLQRKWYF